MLYQPPESKRFFTSDLHLFHENIIGYCNRPFETAKKMWQEIKKNWNETVNSQDEVWVLGDLTLEGSAYIQQLRRMMTSLNGKKHMIVASTHDRLLPREYINIGFDTVHHPIVQLENRWYLGHDPAVATVLKPDDIYICGHVHNLWRSQITDTGVIMINVGVDVSEFRPVSEEELISEVSEKRREQQLSTLRNH